MQYLMLMDVTPVPMGLVIGDGVMTKLSECSTTTHQGGSNLDDDAGSQPRSLIKIPEDERQRTRVTTFSVNSIG